MNPIPRPLRGTVCILNLDGRLVQRMLENSIFRAEVIRVFTQYDAGAAFVFLVGWYRIESDRNEQEKKAEQVMTILARQQKSGGLNLNRGNFRTIVTKGALHRSLEQVVLELTKIEGSYFIDPELREILIFSSSESSYHLWRSNITNFLTMNRDEVGWSVRAAIEAGRWQWISNHLGWKPIEEPSET